MTREAEVLALVAAILEAGDRAHGVAPAKGVDLSGDWQRQYLVHAGLLLAAARRISNHDPDDDTDAPAQGLRQGLRQGCTCGEYGGSTKTCAQHGYRVTGAEEVRP